jgi:hypothetical protein
VDVDHLHGRRRHVLAPDVVDQAIDGDGPVDVEQQARQQRTLGRGAERERRAIVLDLERTEQPDVHRAAFAAASETLSTS